MNIPFSGALLVSVIVGAPAQLYEPSALTEPFAAPPGSTSTRASPSYDDVQSCPVDSRWNEPVQVLRCSCAAVAGPDVSRSVARSTHRGSVVGVVPGGEGSNRRAVRLVGGLVVAASAPCCDEQRDQDDPAADGAALVAAHGRESRVLAGWVEGVWEAPPLQRGADDGNRTRVFSLGS